MKMPSKGQRLTGRDGTVYVVVSAKSAADIGEEFEDMPGYFLVDISTEEEAPLSDEGEWQLDPEGFEFFCQERGIRL